jgi:hypothetical protein
MSYDRLEVRQIRPNSFVTEKLPDGSTAVLDTATTTVHSLNLSAAAAFEACRETKTVPQLMQSMGEILGAPVTEEVALAAVSELDMAGLVSCSEPVPEGDRASRRSLLRSMGTAAAVAVPVVLSLTSAEQRAYAINAGSGGPPPPPPVILSATPNTIPPAIGGVWIAGLFTHFSPTSTVTCTNGVTATVQWIAGSDWTHLSIVTSAVGVPNGTIIDVTVTTGAEVVTGTGLLTVTDADL